MLTTQHHVLIVSGLYGALTPAERIQCYSCHVPDHASIRRTWQGDDFLTDLVVAYMKRHQIAGVFELMGGGAYRNLIAWGRIRSEGRAQVLHGFSKQYAGPDLLPSLGALAGEFLGRPEERLLALRPGDGWELPSHNDTIWFEPVPVPQSGDLAREVARLRDGLGPADKVGRIRRGYIALLRSIWVRHAPREERPYGFTKLATTCARRGYLPWRFASCICDFETWRNTVEYDGYVPRPSEILSRQRDYTAVVRWVERQ